MGAGAGFKAFVAAHGLVFLVTAMALAYKVPAWGSAALSLSGISLPAVLISVAFFVAGVGSNFLRYASWLAAKRSRRAAVVGVLSVAIVAPPIAYLLHRNGGWFDNADFIVGMVVYLVCPVAIATTVLAPSGLPSLAAVIAAIATIVAMFALPFALRGVYGTRFDAWNAVELTKQLTLRVLLPYVCGMLLALHPTISKVARYMSTALCAVHSAIVAAIAWMFVSDARDSMSGVSQSAFATLLAIGACAHVNVLIVNVVVAKVVLQLPDLEFKTVVHTASHKSLCFAVATVALSSTSSDARGRAIVSCVAAFIPQLVIDALLVHYIFGYAKAEDVDGDGDGSAMQLPVTSSAASPTATATGTVVSPAASATSPVSAGGAVSPQSAADVAASPRGGSERASDVTSPASSVLSPLATTTAGARAPMLSPSNSASSPMSASPRPSPASPTSSPRAAVDRREYQQQQQQQQQVQLESAGGRRVQQVQGSQDQQGIGSPRLPLRGMGNSQSNEDGGDALLQPTLLHFNHAVGAAGRSSPRSSAPVAALKWDVNLLLDSSGRGDVQRSGDREGDRDRNRSDRVEDSTAVSPSQGGAANASDASGRPILVALLSPLNSRSGSDSHSRRRRRTSAAAADSDGSGGDDSISEGEGRGVISSPLQRERSRRDSASASPRRLADGGVSPDATAVRQHQLQQLHQLQAVSATAQQRRADAEEHGRSPVPPAGSSARPSSAANLLDAMMGISHTSADERYAEAAGLGDVWLDVVRRRSDDLQLHRKSPVAARPDAVDADGSVWV